MSVDVVIVSNVMIDLSSTARGVEINSFASMCNFIGVSNKIMLYCSKNVVMVI